ncbi:site-2 protease family protein [Rhodoluna sp.]|uniref:M50 family metallopeptidase n=1 Tax=Rhodoluna sp. TaxID=1969481 RepID=UPI0025DED17F|nr:site-2 protease family protein [Rhodoluna sp.]
MTETLWYIGGILFIALGIGFSIGLHELGHLLPAKKFGVKVPTYAIGFGPTLFKFKRGETQYALKLIPLGGYISMIGMYPPAKPGAKKRSGFFGEIVNGARKAHEQHITKADENRMFYQLPVYKRIIVMFGGPFMNLALGTLLLTLVISGIGTYQRTTTIEAIGECVPANTIVSTQCTPSDAPSPAKAAGLKPGDKITAVNGETFSDWKTVQAKLQPDTQAQLTIDRNGQTLNLSITPVAAIRPLFDAQTGQVVTDSAGQPVTAIQPTIGVIFGSDRVPQPVGNALVQSGNAVAQVGQMILTLPKQITDVAVSTFTGQARNPNGAVSVVGIAQISGEVASTESASVIDKLASGLLILASLNFALFAFNMVPLLPLDGGHIAGGIYESIKRGIYRVRGKPDPGPADTALLMPITWFVFMLLMAMSAILILADLVNPISF